MGEDTCDAKITEFDDITAREENVLRFKVTVEDFAVVDVLDGEEDLGEPIQNLLFREVLHTARCFLLCMPFFYL